MIAVMRIRGQVGLKKNIKETLSRLKIRRKYACIILENPNKSQLGMVESVRNFVSYGEISKEIYKELIKKRGKKNKEGKLKPFFRLHPPRGGAKTKLHYPKGILGKNKEMNKLIGRML